MSGCYGDNLEDKYFENMLINHLDSQERLPRGCVEIELDNACTGEAYKTRKVFYLKVLVTVLDGEAVDMEVLDCAEIFEDDYLDGEVNQDIQDFLVKNNWTKFESFALDELC